MQIIRQISLADALAAWGAHELSGRLSAQLTVDSPDKLTSLNFVLQYRAPYVARILMRDPVRTYEVELVSTDAERIVLADKRTLSGWIDTTRTSGGDALSHFEHLVASVTPPSGPFFAAATGLGANAGELDDIVAYDGWHRLSAWYERIHHGKPSSIRGHLVVVLRGDPLMEKVT